MTTPRSNRLWTPLAVLVFALIHTAAFAYVRVMPLFSDHMVLQQGRDISIWGTASVGETVIVRIGDEWAGTRADDNGKWMVRLDPMHAGGPYEISIEGENRIVLRDVLVGEVWLCSGQSNMEWSLSGARDGAYETSVADNPQIRLLRVPHRVSGEPESTIPLPWAVCEPNVASSFSAVGYLFGKRLHDDLRVPIGLIESAWGGTLAEAWTSLPALEADPALRPIHDAYATWQADFAAGTNTANPETSPHRPAALFNGMIAPLIPYAMRGALWYQGESNALSFSAGPKVYETLFPAMISDWRNRWHQGDFPFLFVQLAPGQRRSANRWRDCGRNSAKPRRKRSRCRIRAWRSRSISATRTTSIRATSTASPTDWRVSPLPTYTGATSPMSVRRTIRQWWKTANSASSSRTGGV
ncbi:MAG: hypothetical protein O3A46_06835 [Candidatus Poribacteria bacterium]|nr:hypothetical protein [Candidatus Poribacteria bacterium]